MRVLLSGAAGQLGREFVRGNSAAEDHTVFALTRSELDITNATELTQVIERLSPDIFINCAAYTAVDAAEEAPEIAFAVNQDGPSLVAKACANANIPIIHFSTDYVFSGEKKESYTEDDQALPRGIYARSKWAGECQVRQECEQHLILRLSWVNGVFGDNFLKTMLSLAAQQDPIKVVDDQTGCPTFTAEVVKQVYALLPLLGQDNLWGTYHVCQHPATTWFEFASAIIHQAANYKRFELPEILPISSENYRSLAPRPQHSVLETEKFEKTFACKIDSWQNSLNHVLRELYA